MKFLFSAFLLLSTLSIQAQQAVVKRDTSAGYAYEYVENDPMKVRRYVLNNGLTVYLSPNRTEPRIYSCIAVRAGSKNDPRRNTGLAHYLEHMLFKGTDRYGSLDYPKESIYLGKIDTLYEKYNQEKDPARRKKIYRMIDSVSQIAAGYAIANEYDKMMQHIGATGTNAFTSFDETVYINEIPSNHFDEWLQIEAERFRKPILRLFHTELEAVYEEKNISLDSDDDKVYEALFAKLFPNHTYGIQTTIGTVEHLKNPSLKAIRDYFNKYYVPNNMAVVLAGNLDYDQTIAKVDKAWSAFARIPVEPLEFPEPKTDTIPETVDVFGPESPYVALAYRLPAPKGKDRLTMQVLQELLFNGKSGLLDQNLNKKQRVLDSDASVFNMHDASVLFLSAAPGAGQSLEEVRELLLAQIDSLRKGKFSDVLLQAITLNLETQKIRAMESNASRAFEMVDAFVKETPWVDKVGESQSITKVSRNDVVLFVRKYLKKDYVVVNKREGADTKIEKIEKPEITPVPVNRDAMSHFAKDIYDNEIPEMKTGFADFDKKLKAENLRPGVDWMYVENKQNTLFKLQYVFEFGAMSDPRLALAIEYLKLAGTPNLSSEQLGMELYRLATDMNLMVGPYTTVLQMTGPQASLERAISTLEHLLTQTQKNKTVLKNLIGQTLQERENLLMNKYAISNALRNYALYGEKNPSNSGLSNKKLRKTKPAALVDLLQSLEAQPHTVLYYGADKPEQVKALLTKYHNTAVVPSARFVNRTFEPRPVAAAEVLFTEFDMVQAEIYWTKSLPQADSSQIAVMKLFNEYFDGNMSSIVFQTIRESKALAYSCFARYTLPENRIEMPRITAYVGTQSDKLDSAIYAMNSLLRELPKSERLFESSLSSMRSSLASFRVKDAELASYRLGLNRMGLKSDWRKTVYEKLNRLSYEDIQRFHQSTFAGNSPFLLTVVGSSKSIPREKLSKYGSFREVSKKALFGF